MKRLNCWRLIFILVATFPLIAIVVFKAIPHRAYPRGPRPRPTCRANLSQTEGAKQQWAIDNQMPKDAISAKFDLCGVTPYLKDEQACPDRGEYTIGAISVRPTCRHSASRGHSLP